MKTAKRILCQIFVLSSAMGILLAVGGVIEGTLAPLSGLCAAGIFLLLAESICRVVFFPSHSSTPCSSFTPVRMAALPDGHPRPWHRAA